RFAAVSQIERRPTLRAAADSIAGFVTTLGAMFLGQKAADVGTSPHDSIGAPEHLVAAPPDAAPAYRPRVNPLTEPYAAMVIVARGAAVTGSPHASGVGDR